ncbi:LmbE-like protein [Escherichia coli]|uniref:LmbE-like protein n=1 Tax=Escherichia coli TaxID=562 RepID=A0A377KBB8_ECOLX|nr:LmbE-like protein [Escherichia coli]
MDKVLDSAILSSANKRKGILAIGAHPDDIELGCGASLARLAQKGIYIATVVMTTGNSGVDGIIDPPRRITQRSKDIRVPPNYSS